MPETTAPDPDGPLWVFGYGSLIWNPGFAFEERRTARLRGFRRAFCLRSIRYRGTPEAPGLVLGLDPDPAAECHGVAFRVPEASREEARTYLRWREMATDSYIESFREVEAEGVGRVQALAYVMDTEHYQYARLALAAQAEIIAGAEGPAGPNSDYLHRTAEHLRELGLEDPEMERLDRMVRLLHAERTASGGEARR
ncbi:MAG: gamma-glutamylcyclotransferase [Pseudomonadota bacterium]